MAVKGVKSWEVRYYIRVKKPFGIFFPARHTNRILNILLISTTQFPFFFFTLALFLFMYSLISFINKNLGKKLH